MKLMHVIYNFLPSRIFIAINLLFITSVYSQDMSEEFLSSLPEGLRDQIETQTEKSEQEQEVEGLFRADTSVYNNKKILQNLKKQVEDLGERILFEESNNKELKRFGEEFFSSIQSSFMPINIPNLSSNYIIDVGDELSIMLTGINNQEHKLFVQRDGSLIIPEFGKIYVSGRSLDESAELIKNFIETSAVGINAFITLSAIRDVQIIMLGGVKSPGIYTVSGGSNPVFALNVAGGISENGSFRKIDHRRNGKTIQSIDLYDIFVYGEYNIKHQLRSGDIIFVHPPKIQIPISGGIYNPNVYEMLEGQSLGNIVEYAGGFKEGFYGFNKVAVKRTSIDRASTQEVAVNDISDFKLQHRDVVSVPFYDNQFEEIKSITIEGMVNKPGKYYINDGEKLSSVINRAGGYKEKAYIFWWYVAEEGCS